MDHQPDPLSRADLANRILDVALGGGIEVFLAERGGIEVVEQLSHLAQSQLDEPVTALASVGRSPR
jgi:hypothetical protein